MKQLLFVVLIVCISIFGCKDQLNQYPPASPSSETFYANKDELNLALTGVYHETLWFEYHDLPEPMRLENGTDLSFERQGFGMKPITNGNADSQTDIFKSTWNFLYGSISQANDLLENMNKAKNVSEDYLRTIGGQARFLRAFSYLYLTELYGDVPLLTNIPSIENAKKISRTPKDTVVNQIIRDLDYAAQNLPLKWPSSDKGRASKGAALALKARIGLYNKKWNLAAEAAKQVMNSGIYSLYPDYEAQFQYKGQRSSGVILDADYEKGIHGTGYERFLGSRNNAKIFSSQVPTQALIDSYEAADGKPIDQSTVYDPSYPFRNRDPRLDASIVRPQSIWGNFVFETNPDSVKTWVVDNSGNYIGRMGNSDATNPYATYTGYLWRKYNSPQDINDVVSSSLNFIYIRYAEVLLIYAEAKIEMGDIDQSVLNAINRVRARAYEIDPSQTSEYPQITTTNQDKLRKQVRYERKVEFAGEGLRLFDLKRWKIANDAISGTLIGRPKGAYSSIPRAPEIGNNGIPHYGSMKSLYRNVEERIFEPNKDYLWAIPQSELDLNPKLKQNPGY